MMLDLQEKLLVTNNRIMQLEAELAASREMGPCGHPKMFWVEAKTLLQPWDAPEINIPYCTLCVQQAEIRQAAQIEMRDRCAIEAYKSYKPGNGSVQMAAAAISNNIRALALEVDGSTPGVKP